MRYNHQSFSLNRASVFISTIYQFYRIIILLYFLSGMKPKSIEKLNFFRSPPSRTDRSQAPVYVVSSMNNSTQKSSRSTHLSERSSSRQKIMIPRSPKLAHFFNSSRPLSSSKSYSTSSTQYLINRDRMAAKQQQRRPQKIEFLNFKVNRDYFDEYTEHNLKDNLDKIHEKAARNTQSQRKQKDNQEQRRTKEGQSTSRDNVYTSLTLIKSEKKISFPKLKYTNSNGYPAKVMVKPIEKIMAQKDKAQAKHFQKKYDQYQLQEKPKIQTKKEFQYTFGINY